MITEMIIIAILAAIFSGVLLIYRNLQQIKHNKKIIDTVPNIVLIYKNSALVEVNQSFFNYFDKYGSVKDFVNKNGSIGNFFEPEEGYLHAIALDGSGWFDYVKEVKSAKVKIKIEKKEYYFSMNVSVIDTTFISIVLSDITQLVKSQQEIKSMTLVDPETNIGNRRYFDQKIKQEVAVAQRYKHSLSLVMCEIDNFKELENLHGEALTSKLQTVYVKLIASLLREIDIYCRYSGSKFMIILPSTDLSGARKVAEKLKNAVSSSQKILPITMSFGVTTYIPGNEITMFLTKADKALLSAKESGTSRIVLG